LHCPGDAVSVEVSSASPVTVGGSVFDGGMPISEPVRSVPLYLSRSVQPETPGTWPQSVYCQNVHPYPPQFLPGTRGAGLSVQGGAHISLNPASAYWVVSPMYGAQK